MKRRSFLAAGIGLAAASTAAWAQDPRDLTHDPDQPILGNPDGDVTLVEFFDYQCPYCRESHESLLDLVRQDGNLRLIMRDWPIFGEASVHAMKLGLGAVDLGLYPEVNRALMAITGRRIDRATMDDAVVAVGLDPAAALAAYAEKEVVWRALVSRTNWFAEFFGLFGTPSYVIGRDVYQGVTDLAIMRQAIANTRAG